MIPSWRSVTASIKTVSQPFGGQTGNIETSPFFVYLPDVGENGLRFAACIAEHRCC